MSGRWGKLVKSLLATGSVLRLLERADEHKTNLLRVLAYHRVDVPASRVDYLTPSLISATPTAFAQQMQFLARHYRILSAQEVVAHLTSGKEIPSRAVFITFDDGYRDFAEQAWPIMRQLNLPVTHFIATAYPNDPSRIFWWEQLYQGLRKTARTEITVNGLGSLPLTNETERVAAFNQIKKCLRALEHHQATVFLGGLMTELDVIAQPGDALLGWNDIRDLADEGVAFAAHTRTHPFLSRLTPAQMHDEVSGALFDLEQEAISSLPIFCYPDGHPDTFNDNVVGMLRQIGIIAAFTTVRGINMIGQANFLALRRLVIGMSDSMSMFRLLLTSSYTRLRRYDGPVG